MPRLMLASPADPTVTVMREVVCIVLMIIVTWIIADPMGFADAMSATNAAFFSEVGR